MGSKKCDSCGKCAKKPSTGFTNNGETVIALLGQPNSGKSSIFNRMTGAHQHVGNWPGKTVEQKEGTFKYNDVDYLLADLPGSYSLSAGSEEEVITRDYIENGNADIVVVLADASQLRRSLYMLADFVGNPTPAILALNMMDVAKLKGIQIDVDALSDKLGIPVIPMTAIDKKSYNGLYAAIEETLKSGTSIHQDKLETADRKLAWIDSLLADTYVKEERPEKIFTRFDRIATGRFSGKFLAVGIILSIFLVSMMFAGVVGGVAGAVVGALGDALRTGFGAIHVHPLLISLVCDVLLNVLYFATMMSAFVLGITFGFTLLEEAGYLARVSYVFDNLMSKVGLQGKAIMPFFMGFGCTIAGTTGTRVIDNWGQRVLAIAMSWAIPCAATLSVMPTIAITLFGAGGGFLVMAGILLFMFLMMLRSENIINSVTFNKEISVLNKHTEALKIEMLRLDFMNSSNSEIIFETEKLIDFIKNADMLNEYSDDLFSAFVNKIIIYDRNNIGFELKCGLILREMI